MEQINLEEKAISIFKKRPQQEAYVRLKNVKIDKTTFTKRVILFIQVEKRDRWDESPSVMLR